MTASQPLWVYVSPSALAYAVRQALAGGMTLAHVNTAFNAPAAQEGVCRISVEPTNDICLQTPTQTHRVPPYPHSGHSPDLVAILASAMYLPALGVLPLQLTLPNKHSVPLPAYIFMWAQTKLKPSQQKNLLSTLVPNLPSKEKDPHLFITYDTSISVEPTPTLSLFAQLSTSLDLGIGARHLVWATPFPVGNKEQHVLSAADLDWKPILADLIHREAMLDILEGTPHALFTPGHDGQPHRQPTNHAMLATHWEDAQLVLHGDIQPFTYSSTAPLLKNVFYQPPQLSTQELMQWHLVRCHLATQVQQCCLFSQIEHTLC